MRPAREMEWRQLAAFPDYEVSECGDVRLCTSGSRLRGYVNTDGYHAYALTGKDGRQRQVLAHRLVAQTFLPTPADHARTEVAHLDGSKLNCRFDNLCWSSPKDNQRDRKVHGTAPVGEQNGRAKITEADVRTIRREYREIKVPGSGRRVTELEDRFGLHRATILDIAKGRSWTHV